MATQKKIDTVKSMTEKVQKAKSLIFVDYGNIKHKQLEELRKGLRKNDAEFMVTKNTLFLRAMGDNGETVKEHLKGKTGTLFNYGDEVAGLKELTKFLKAAAVGKAKGGFMGGNVMSAAQVDQLAKLPGKEVMLGRLVGQLQAPLSSLHYALSWNLKQLVYALNAVKEKKG